jgi:hypothetical protein
MPIEPNESVSVKLCFALDVQDGWPPVATEWVWCRPVGDAFELRNVPFFIEGLAFGDQFLAEPDTVNGCIFDFKVVKSSGHSVVWVMNNKDLDLQAAKAALHEQGCGFEGFPDYKLLCVDVPSETDRTQINALLDQMERDGLDLACPVWRHDLS